MQEIQAESCFAGGKGLELGDSYNPTGHWRRSSLSPSSLTYGAFVHVATGLLGKY